MIKIRAERDMCRGSINIFIADVYRDRVLLASPMTLEFKEIQGYKPNAYLPQSKITPTLMVDSIYAEEFFSKLVEALGEARLITPPENNSAELKATRIHLEDMRKLTFFKVVGVMPNEEKKP